MRLFLARRNARSCHYEGALHKDCPVLALVQVASTGGRHYLPWACLDMEQEQTNACTRCKQPGKQTCVPMLSSRLQLAGERTRRHLNSNEIDSATDCHPVGVHPKCNLRVSERGRIRYFSFSLECVRERTGELSETLIVDEVEPLFLYRRAHAAPPFIL